MSRMANEYTLKRLFKYLFLFITVKFSYLESAITKSHPLQVNLTDVQIYHVIDNALWGEVDGSALQGIFACPEYNLRCELLSSDTKTNFLKTTRLKYINTSISRKSSGFPFPLTVSLYNIHTWKTLSKFPYAPDRCSLPSHFTMAESEESFGRFEYLFKNSFVHFDGNSTTSPYSTIQRTYIPNINISQFLPLRSFETMIKGAAFVASTCHRSSTTKRDEIVKELQSLMRVDGLGKCRHTPPGPEGISLSVGGTPLESLLLKQAAISNYLFYFAFENTREPGYVTEKVFDALIAGTVPVYLGSSEDCKKIVPFKHAVIYVDDFDSISSLSKHLIYLAKTKSAYDEYRSWRQNFTGDLSSFSPLLKKSWPCRICEWAFLKASHSGVDLVRPKC